MVLGFGNGVSLSKQMAEPVHENDCRICLEQLSRRTSVQLGCSHRYHLDCIGSAFNAKNKMQCPTCRQVEDGEWLYAKPRQDIFDDEFNIEDLFSRDEIAPEQSLDMFQQNMGMHGPQVRSENMLPYAHNYLDRIIPNTDHRLASFAPHESPDVFRVYHDASGRVDYWENMRLQQQLRDQLAWHDEQRRLIDLHHRMYGYDGSSGGFGHGGASNGYNGSTGGFGHGGASNGYGGSSGGFGYGGASISQPGSSSGGGNGGWPDVVYANGGGTTGVCICGFCHL